MRRSIELSNGGGLGEGKGDFAMIETGIVGGSGVPVGLMGLTGS
jgi:hypothetical protein